MIRREPFGATKATGGLGSPNLQAFSALEPEYREPLISGLTIPIL
jgi:hypothetical protein